EVVAQAAFIDRHPVADVSAANYSAWPRNREGEDRHAVSPLTRTIALVAYVPTMGVGALITACQCPTERNWMLSFAEPGPEAGMVTCSMYVPGQTLMRSPGAAASTAAWTVE